MKGVRKKGYDSSLTTNIGIRVFKTDKEDFFKVLDKVRIDKQLPSYIDAFHELMTFIRKYYDTDKNFINIFHDYLQLSEITFDLRHNLQSTIRELLRKNEQQEERIEELEKELKEYKKLLEQN